MKKRHAGSHRGRWYRVALATFALLLAGACADMGPEPMVPELDQAQVLDVHGRVLSSFWLADAEGSYTYLGSLGLDVETAPGDARLRARGPATTEVLSDTELESMRSYLPRNGKQASVIRGDPMAVQGSPSAQPPIVIGDGVRAHASVGNSGEELLVVREFDGTVEGQPPVEFTLFVDRRLAMTKSLRYERSGDTWRPVWSRSTHFDEDGSIWLVTEQDLSGLSFDASGPRRRLSSLLESAGAAACHLMDLLGPTPLQAAVVQSDEAIEHCSEYQDNLNAALLVEYAASAAFGVALSNCVFPEPGSSLVGCPAALAAALVLAAAKNVVETLRAHLQNCIKGYDKENGEMTFGQVRWGSRWNSATGKACELWVMLVSWDGGRTWEFVREFLVCEEGESDDGGGEG